MPKPTIDNGALPRNEFTEAWEKPDILVYDIKNERVWDLPPYLLADGNKHNLAGILKAIGLEEFISQLQHEENHNLPYLHSIPHAVLPEELTSMPEWFKENELAYFRILNEKKKLDVIAYVTKDEYKAS